MRDETRSADGSSEQVLAIFRNGMATVEEVVGIEGVVAEILPKVAMQAVGSGLHCRIDDAAGRMPELGVEVAVLDLEFFYSIGRRNNRRVRAGVVAAVELDVVVDAVETK